MSTCAWYSSWLISSAVASLPSCSAAIQDSAASSRSFLPMAWTPASSAATVPDPAGRVWAFSASSAHRPSNVFTTVKRSAAGARASPGVRARTASVEVDATDVPQGLRRDQRGRGGFVALVLDRVSEARAVERLPLGVARQHPEPDGRLVVQGDAVEAVGRGGADVVEVRRASADDDPERDHGVVTLTRQGVRDHRELEGTGNADDLRLLDPVVLQGPQRAVDQTIHHLLVPARRDHGDPKVVAVERALVGGTVSGPVRPPARAARAPSGRASSSGTRGCGRWAASSAA